MLQPDLWWGILGKESSTSSSDLVIWGREKGCMLYCSLVCQGTVESRYEKGSKMQHQGLKSADRLSRVSSGENKPSLLHDADVRILALVVCHRLFAHCSLLACSSGPATALLEGLFWGFFLAMKNSVCRFFKCTSLLAVHLE